MVTHGVAHVIVNAPPTITGNNLQGCLWDDPNLTTTKP
jgi:hypothetical protein